MAAASIVKEVPLVGGLRSKSQEYIAQHKVINDTGNSVAPP
jgi:hypothetical protein